MKVLALYFGIFSIFDVKGIKMIACLRQIEWYKWYMGFISFGCCGSGCIPQGQSPCVARRFFLRRRQISF